LGKLAASCTAIQQPCDRGNIFKGAKKSNRGINDNDVIQNVDMHDLIIKVINSHEKNKSSDQKMSSNHKNMLRHGLLRVQKALQKTLNTQTISDSFKNTGMYPLSLVKTLQQCRDKRSDNIDNMIIKKMPDFIKIFKDNGVIKDSDLIASGIPSAMAKETKNPKDKLTISHQRAVLLSHEESLVRWKAVEAAKTESVTAKEKRKIERTNKNNNKRKIPVNEDISEFKRAKITYHDNQVKQADVATIDDGITMEASRSNPKRNRIISKRFDGNWLLRDDDSDYE
jgi:hypothetical protein